VNTKTDWIEAHADHRRVYQDYIYVYPVISRRSQGVSIGINLNPDKICNFDCVYCEVDRTTPPRKKKVDLPQLEEELRAMMDIWKDGSLFNDEPFASAPPSWHRLNDIAFSGDGEPTTCPVFEEAVEIAYRLRDEIATPETKLVLITDSACLDRPGVIRGLQKMSQGPHEIWAKLDAGTPEYYKQINRSAIPFDRILKNILETAKRLPITIQTLWHKTHGEIPSEAEVEAYIHRLQEMKAQGGQIQQLQLYTIARPTPEAFAEALTRPQLDAIAQKIHDAFPVPQVLGYGKD
jgi:wyosine [tRNA(Phe)-imidazoG37] synthetase (radical SAM superfamily)